MILLLPSSSSVFTLPSELPQSTKNKTVRKKKMIKMLRAGFMVFVFTGSTINSQGVLSNGVCGVENIKKLDRLVLKVSFCL